VPGTTDDRIVRRCAAGGDLLLVRHGKWKSDRREAQSRGFFF
jgi:hypothetical protein